MIRFATLTAIVAVTLTCTANYSYGQLFQRFRGNDRCCRQPVFQTRACQPMCCQPVRQNCCMVAPGCGCDSGNVVVNPSNPGNPGDLVRQDPGLGGEKQDCQDEYTKCCITCSMCEGVQRDECLTYCACQRAVCNGTGSGPCPMPACGGVIADPGIN